MNNTDIGRNFCVEKVAVVIVAAGRGQRLGEAGGPKQYRMLGDASLLQHTLDCFTDHPAISVVQVVIHPDDYELYKSAVAEHPKVLSPVNGGKTRQESCKAGIDALPLHDIDKVLIHDAARPFVPAALIDKVVAGISSNICALPAIAVADTVKRADEKGVVQKTIPRENLHLAQTPQGFLLEEIKTAHSKAARDTSQEFTDDAALAEWSGMAVKIVEGDRNNFKITTQQDFSMALQKITTNMTHADIRTGSGYDVHTLGPGKEIVLCGINIPHNKSLQGHSDADVGLHALTDALLGTIGDGDIGSHFPPSDPQWKSVSSDRFLEHAAKLVQSSGGIITNLDVTIICEAPKISPHRNLMRAKISEICNLEIERVSVKATTNEKIGFLGREEGIAAIASATVSFGVLKSV